MRLPEGPSQDNQNSEPGEAGRPGRRVALIVLAWTGIALFFSVQNVVRFVARGQEVQWFSAVVLEILYWVPWAVLTPALLYLVRRFRLEPQRWKRMIWPHFGAALLVSVAQVGAYFGLRYLILLAQNLPPSEFEQFGAGLGPAFPVLVLTAFWKYWVFVGVYYAFDYYRKYRERELRASQLEAQLAVAQLSSLRMQLHPHFLFNALHSVSMLSLSDGEAAHRFVVKLSDLLRFTLDHVSDQLVPLKTEFDFLDRYLSIEHARFEDRLSVEFQVEDGLRDALVPNLILQPLVENAIRHGVGKIAGPGRIEIQALRDDEQLVLEVSDNGPGLPPKWQMEDGAGLGLANVRARLRALYGSAHSLEFDRRDGGGVVARVIVPLRRSERPPAPTADSAVDTTRTGSP